MPQNEHIELHRSVQNLKQFMSTGTQIILKSQIMNYSFGTRAGNFYVQENCKCSVKVNTK
jgi:hypothetical protein